MKSFHGIEVTRYVFYILIIAYPLISFRAVNRDRQKNLYIKRMQELSIKVIGASDERVNLDCIESSIVLSIDNVQTESLRVS